MVSDCPRLPLPLHCRQPRPCSRCRHRRASALGSRSARSRPRSAVRLRDQRQPHRRTVAVARLLDRRHQGRVTGHRGRQGREPHADGEHGSAHPARLRDRHGDLRGIPERRRAPQRRGGRADREGCAARRGRHESALRGEPASVARLRSGPERRVSMPGMLDTILNVGLCDVTVPGPAPAHGRSRLCLGLLPAADPYRTPRWLPVAAQLFDEAARQRASHRPERPSRR